MNINQSKKRLIRKIFAEHLLPGMEVREGDVSDALRKMPSRIAAVERTKTGSFRILELGDHLKAGRHRADSISAVAVGAAASFRDAESVEATEAIASNYQSNLAKNKKQYEELFALLKG